MNTKKGFTLLELLIVIGILAILSTTVVLVINPAELLAKARDSQRISDLNTVKTAIAYYITEVRDPSIVKDNYTSYSHVTGVACTGTATSSVSQAINGTGWIPVPFDDLTGGSPISSLPIDPNASDSASDNYYYVYLPDATNLTFKLIANMESAYYKNGGDGNVESTDGGNNVSLYEVGTDMGITITTGTNCYSTGA
jgi:prepilin-type N-terminal cleavage/methylation domain-containing protein